MSLVCFRMSSVCHSYVICMSLVCTPMSSVCHSYALVCHPYFTRMYSYVIRMSLVCHLYVTLMYSYVIRMSLNIQLLNISFFRFLLEDFEIFLVFRVIFTGRFLNANQKDNSSIFEGKFCFPNLEMVSNETPACCQFF